MHKLRQLRVRPAAVENLGVEQEVVKAASWAEGIKERGGQDGVMGEGKTAGAARRHEYRLPRILPLQDSRTFFT